MPARRSADQHIRISDHLPPRLLTRPDEWKRLRLLLTNTEGGVILFGLYRSVAGRELVVKSLRREGPLPVLEITLTTERPSLFRQLEELDERPRSLVSVYGLEEVPEALRILNLARERFHHFSHVFLFWVTPGGLKRIASEAPDFWDWRTAVLDFTTPPEGIPIQAVQAVLSEPLEHDTAEELQRRLKVYESLLKDLHPSAAAKGLTAEKIKIDLLLRLGIGAYQLGDYSKARRAWEEALSLAEKIGSPAAEAALLHNLGGLHGSQGDYNEAERLYRESLEIKKQLGDKAGLATTLAQLALLEEAKGNIDGALELTKQAEKMFKEIGAYHLAEKAHRQMERQEGQKSQRPT